MREFTVEQFLSDVAGHTMEAKLDSGGYRHLMFSSAGLKNQHFELVTYGDKLVISGDMGDYVFSRREDMFRFFRRDDLSVNLGYWTEKLVCTDRTLGHKKHSEKAVMDSIQCWVDNICEDIEDYYEESEEKEDYPTIKQFEQAFRDEVGDHFKYEEMSEFRFLGPIYDFESLIIDDLSMADDYDWLHSTEYVYQYLWCLHAIVWGIQQYDKSKKAVKLGVDANYDPSDELTSYDPLRSY